MERRSRDLMMSSSNDEGQDDVVTDDVLFEIFLFLPADSLLRFRYVSKYWFNLITSNICNPRFVEMHTHHLHHHSSHATTIDNLPTILCTSTSTQHVPYHHLYSLNNNNTSSSSSCMNKKIDAIEIVYPFQSPSSQLEILGSCNGLLCILVTDYNDHNIEDYGINTYTNNRPMKKTVCLKGFICLWNPTTNEFKHLPRMPIEKPGHNVRVSNITYGFGFDRFIKDYKLVRLMRFTDQSQGIKVYTLGTNSWKRVDTEMPNDILHQSTKVGLYVDGALHWISGDRERIYSFNIEDEEFREVPKPERFDIVKYGAGLQVLRGCLCIFSGSFDRHIEHVFEVWMMMDYGVKESWTKLLTTSMNLGWTRMGPSGNLKPLWIYKNNEVLIGSGAVQWGSKHLAIYDPNNNKVIETIGIQGIPVNRTKEIVHIRSFVSLKSGTYVDRRTIEEERNKKRRRRRKLLRKMIYRSMR